MSRVWAFLACWIWLTNIYELLDVLHYISAAKAPVQMVRGSFRVRRVWNTQSRSASTDSLSWEAISCPDWFSPNHEQVTQTGLTKSLTQKNTFLIRISLVYIQQMLIRVHIETFDCSLGESEHSLRQTANISLLHCRNIWEILKGSHLRFVF